MDDMVTAWIDDYLRAWESNEPDDIRALFTETAEYRTEPYSDPWTGHDAIVAGWLEARDAPGETTFRWARLVTTDDLAVITASTAYANGPTYSNLWVIRFAADGRAGAFTEWWMEQPGTPAA